MKKVVLLRYGEIHLKGKNRGLFEKQLIDNIMESLLKVDENVKLKKIGGRYLLYDFNEDNLDLIVHSSTKISIRISISVATEVESSPEAIEKSLKNLLENEELNLFSAKTFKVEVSRADKSFPIHSTDFERQLGGIVLDFFPNLKVNLSLPEKTIFVDIRENKKAYIFMDKIQGAGGIPVGTSGKGLVMLSGGIDSPVAAYLMAKRGMKLSAVHFHSFPYTSEQAKEKVVQLAKIVSKYTGSLKLYVVSFTKIQEEIHKNCKSAYMITIMRRIMMRICEKLSEKFGFQAIITGENLGQVASQTVESMTSTESVLKNLPVFRPLIGFDKIEIIKLSRLLKHMKLQFCPMKIVARFFFPKIQLLSRRLTLLKEKKAS